MKKALLVMAVASTVVGAASADSISTLYARNNGGSFGGAVYFDVTVHNANGITVTGYETNTNETVQFGWSVYVRANDTSFGNETTAAGWALVATGTGQGLGLDAASQVTLDNTFDLAAGTHGMALVMGPEAGHDYTNGDGTNQNYNNGDVELNLGSATNVPFTGPLFNGRVWNGEMFYNIVPAPGAFALLGLAGFAVRRRRRE